MKKQLGVLLSLILLVNTWTYSQQSNDVRIGLNESGSNYVKLTGLGQIWVRNTQLNPGSTINGFSQSSYSDISIRRLRFQVIGQLSDRVFFYTQFGQNNFNYSSTKYTGAFFHDAYLEYRLKEDLISIGGGLSGYNGLARYASPSIGSILSLDAPLFLQATNGVNDQFLRKLSIHAKGQIGKLDYRLMITQPMTVTNAKPSPDSHEFSFANQPPYKQLQAYLKYMFWDTESNQTPYQAGSYLGKKRIFNIGAGVISQKDAMWALDADSNVVNNNMLLSAVDLFVESPLNNGSVITWYAVGTNYHFGKDYVRYVGVDNPASTNTSVGLGGDAFPMVGNGKSFYTQIGYMFGNKVFENAKLQPFACVQISDYNKYESNVIMYETGVNLLLNSSHSSKLSLVYQSRPVYNISNKLDSRKGMTILQYQVSF